jgi:iron complex outermembrane recepter protein
MFVCCFIAKYKRVAGKMTNAKSITCLVMSGALACIGIAPHDAIATEDSASNATSLNEIVVTAEKREERLQEVPVPVTAISADTLINTNQLRLQDYYTTVPGLIVQPTGGSGQNQSITIRGISAGGGNPTVGVTVDEVPYGSSTNVGGGFTIEDIDPSDLQRVEVLRGPQGTLYGANSLGGLIRFITVDPSTDGVSGRVQAGTNSVYNGAELGYSFRGAVNVPLSDTLAIRASAFTRQDPGYVDNPVLGIDGINEVKAYGSRISSLWRPSDIFSLKLSALYQDVKGDGANDVNIAPGLGDLQQDFIRNVGSYEKKAQAYSAIANAKVGNIALTSVTGYNVNAERDTYDYTYALGQCCTQPNFGVTGTPLANIQTAKKFTQEIRLSMPLGQMFDWLVGAFYTHENSPSVAIFEAEDPATGRIVGQGLYEPYSSTYTEYAGFTDLTIHFTDRFDVQIGGRESQIKQHTPESATIGNEFCPPPACPPTPLQVTINPELNVNSNSFTYLVTPRFKVSSDLMVYARFASGFRPGGPNGIPGVPRQFYPDTTKNYELGVKGDFIDHTLTLDASLYYIDWKNIQLSVLDPVVQQVYNGNASRAKSEGVEISGESRPLTGLKINGWIALNKAVLTQDLPLGTPDIPLPIGVAGDSLGASKFSGSLSVQQDFSLTDAVTAFVGSSVSYYSKSLGAFTTSLPPSPFQRQVYPAYARTDLRGGLKYGFWTCDIYANNVADKRAPIAGGIQTIGLYDFNYIQPRTIGISITRKF